MHVPRWVDVAAATLILTTTMGTFQISPDRGERAADVGALLLTVLAAFAVACIRHWPRTAFAVVVCAAAGYEVVGYPAGPFYLTAPLGVALLSLYRGWRWASVGAVLLMLAVFTRDLIGPVGSLVARATLAIGWAGLGVLAGEVARGVLVRRDAARQDRRRAQEQVRMAQRLAIAQDLHDGLAHALSVVTIQSRVAARHMPPGPGADALATLTETSSNALAELNTMVRALRGDDPAPTAPIESLDQVDDLVAAARAAGQRVQLTTRITSRPGLAREVAGYRVVQEALTNARRHAGGVPIQVEVTSDATGLSVIVGNAPAAQPHPASRNDRSREGTGLGLVGMRERVQATGGRLEVGPMADGGWKVAARWTTSTS